MRVVHISVSDKENGAYLAGFRLHKGLLSLGVDSTMFVARRLDDSGDETIKVYRQPTNFFLRAKTRAYRYWISRDLVRYERRKDGPHFIFDRAPEGRRPISQIPMADVIYIHAAHGFINFQALSLLPQRAQIVFVLHDMAFFTGGCAQDLGCGRFTNCCGVCPVFRTHSEDDPSRRVWKRKRTTYSHMRGRLHFVAPSRWIAREASRSSLLQDFPIEVIPNSLDTELFRPQTRSVMRELLGIPKDAHVVGFVSHTLDRPEKGFPFLVKALATMKDSPGLFLITVGGGKLPVDVGTPHLRLGRIYDSHSLCAFYSAADIVAIPSLNDNLPSVAIESMACGTPTVAFAVGGIPEMVRHGVTGVLVPVGDTEALGKAIKELLRDSSARARMAENGRKIAVEEYSMSVQAKQHAEFCARITSLPTPMVKSTPLPEPSQGDRSHLSEVRARQRRGSVTVTSALSAALGDRKEKE